MVRPKELLSLVLVTPALADANNGNWQTARRWAALLRGHYRVRLTAAWPDGTGGKGGDEDALMLALHARRSAPSIVAWHARYPERPLVLVLTGTDLYRDIGADAAAQRSLALADQLVVLNELGAGALPPEHRAKARVILQSSRPRRPGVKTQRHLRALMVGHLREEKSPGTYFAAARLLAHRRDIHLDHIGGPLDAALAAQARALAASHRNYRWLGALPHARTREHIARAHVLVHASRMEGGAHVVIEAIQSGTPVLASRIDGNLGLLGAAYPGVFECDDAAGLAALLVRARDDATMLPLLQRHIAGRAPCFQPEQERAALLALLEQTLRGRRT